MDEFLGIEIGGSLKFIISAVTLILFVVYARLKPLHVLQPIFNWVGEGMANINELLDWALIPVIIVIKTFFKGIFIGIGPIINLFQHKREIVLQKDQVAVEIDCDKEKKEATEP